MDRLVEVGGSTGALAQARLCRGEFHFGDCGFRILSCQPRIFPHPAEAGVLAQIRQFAMALGADPERAMRDARPLQLVFHAISS